MIHIQAIVSTKQRPDGGFENTTELLLLTDVVATTLASEAETVIASASSYAIVHLLADVLRRDQGKMDLASGDGVTAQELSDLMLDNIYAAAEEACAEHRRGNSTSGDQDDEIDWREMFTQL